VGEKKQRGKGGSGCSLEGKLVGVAGKKKRGGGGSSSLWKGNVPSYETGGTAHGVLEDLLAERKKKKRRWQFASTRRGKKRGRDGI